MNFREYIENRRWYRGTLASEDPTKRKKKTSHWTTDKPYAENAAHIDVLKTKFIPELGHTAQVAIREKPGQLITAQIHPKKIFIGNEPALARKLGLIKEYEHLRYDELNNLAAEILIITEARKRGYDTQVIAKDQIQILNPRVIKVLKAERVAPRSQGVGYANRNKTRDKPRQVVLTFDPTVMIRDKQDPKVIYDSTRKLVDTTTTTSGNIYVGVKDKPSQLEIRDTIIHEKCHRGHKVAKTYLMAAQQELQAYEREKEQSTARRWNRVLSVRVEDFLPSVSYLTKPQQIKIAPDVRRILSPKGVMYSDIKGQRLSRRAHRGWKRIY